MVAFGLFIAVAASCTAESTPRLSAPPVILADPDETFDPLLAGADRPAGYRDVTGRDRIQPVYAPTFIAGDNVEWPPGGLVLGVVIEGEARAYPIDFLAAREMINDVHGDIPTLVSW